MLLDETTKFKLPVLPGWYKILKHMVKKQEFGNVLKLLEVTVSLFLLKS